jgi:hypothetical protein
VRTLPASALDDLITSQSELHNCTEDSGEMRYLRRIIFLVWTMPSARSRQK